MIEPYPKIHIVLPTSVLDPPVHALEVNAEPVDILREIKESVLALNTLSPGE